MVARARRPWSELSPAYRRRLERAGIDRAAYASGAPLSAARGHAATPEHPDRVAKTPEKFKGYLARKGQRGLHLVWRPERSDGLVPLSDRTILVTGLSKPDRSLVAAYTNARTNALNNKANNLATYEGRSIRGRLVAPNNSLGPLRRFELETSLDVLSDIALSTPAMQFESLYEVIA